MARLRISDAGIVFSCFTAPSPTPLPQGEGSVVLVLLPLPVREGQPAPQILCPATEQIARSLQVDRHDRFHPTGRAVNITTRWAASAIAASMCWRQTTSPASSPASLLR